MRDIKDFLEYNERYILDVLICTEFSECVSSLKYVGLLKFHLNLNYLYAHYEYIQQC